MTDKRIRIILDSKQADKNAKELDKSIAGVGAAADNTTFAVKRLASAIASALAVDRIVRYADAWTQVENQVRRTVDSEEDLIRTTTELLEVSNDTRSGIEATTALYTSLSIATKSLGTTQEEVIDVTKTINNLFLEAGKSASETEGAIRQLGQALESGTLRGDEFNSVAEGAPGILRAIESATGKTRAELRELAADGQITAEVLINSLQDYAEEAQKAADKTERTLAQSFVVAENNATAFVGASRLVSETVNVTGDAIVTLSENLNVLFGVIGAGAALYIARLIPAITSSTAAFVAQTAAALRATQTVNAMGVVVAKTSVQMNVMAASTRAASAALAFLGGPAGIAFLAVAGLVAYASGMFDAAEETEQLTEKTDVLTKSIEGLTAAQAEAQRLDVVAAISEQESAIDSLQAKIERMQITTEEGFTLTFDSFDETELIKAEAAIDSARQKLDALRSRLGNLDTIVEGGEVGGGVEIGGTSETDQRRLDNFKANLEAQTASLQRELDLRKSISQIYRDGELAADASQFEQQRAAQQAEEQIALAELEAKAAEDVARRQLQFETRLQTLAVEDEQEKALRAEFANQQLAADEILQQQRTAIEKQGAKDREAIARIEAQTRLDTWSGLAKSGLAILSAFGNDSFQSQKNFAIAEGIVNIAGGVAKALNNPYPANLGFAAQVGIQGAALIRTIKSAKPGAGGSSPSVSAAAPSASQSQTASSVQTQEPRPTTINLVGLNPDELVSGRQVANLLEEYSSDGGVVRVNFQSESQ